MSDLDAFLDQGRTGLTAQFAGSVGAETISRCITEAYVALHRAAYADQHLLMAHHGRGRVNVRSAGSRPDATVAASATAVLAEMGVNLADVFAQPLTDDVLRAANVVVTAGAGDACPRVPGPRYDVRDLPHPPGSDLATVRAVRDDIDARVRRLLTELTT